VVKRWTFNIVAAVSLLLCAATVVMWVRSYWTQYVLSSGSVQGEFRRGNGVDDLPEVKYDVGKRGCVVRHYGLASARGTFWLVTEQLIAPPWDPNEIAKRIHNPWSFPFLRLPKNAERTTLSAFPPDQSFSSIFENPRRAWWWLGFDYRRESVSDPDPVLTTSYEARWYRAPHWAIATLWAVLPAVFLARRWRQRRRKRHGFCLICGYDLRASPERCPECGTLVHRATATVSRSRANVLD
jgi:hypothetical protein